MSWCISPDYKNTDFSLPLSIDDKITIFFDRVDGWQLGIADQCINGRKGPNGEIEPIPDSGFAVLHIVLSYFEMIAKYQDGFEDTGESGHYFKKGVYSVFPQFEPESLPIVDSLLDILYSGARCGLYHSGMTDSRIILTGGGDEPIELLVFDPQKRGKVKLRINPHLLVPVLRTHLRDYVEQLRDAHNSTLRQNFEKRFDFEASQA